MFILTCIRSKVVLGMLVAAALFGGSLVQSTQASAGFGSSPGRRSQTIAITNNYATGEHLKEVTIELWR